MRDEVEGPGAITPKRPDTRCREVLGEGGSVVWSRVLRLRPSFLRTPLRMTADLSSLRRSKGQGQIPTEPPARLRTIPVIFVPLTFSGETKPFRTFSTCPKGTRLNTIFCRHA